MDENGILTAKTVFDFAISSASSDQSADPKRRDLLILQLKIDDGIVNFALDRRTVERLSEGLAKVATKLSAPRHEN